MRIETRNVGRIVVLAMSGRLVFGKGDVLLRRTFRESLEAGQRWFVFDMAHVRLMDTAAIAETVACAKRIRDRDGVIKLVLRGRWHDLYTFYELHKVFEIFESLEDALASFAPAEIRMQG